MAIFHSYVSHSQRVTTTKSRPSPKASVTSRVARVLGRKWAPPGSESGATRNWNSYNFYGFKASSLILTVFMAIRQTISPMWFTLFFLLLCWRVYVCFRMIYTICNNTTVWVSWDQIFLVGHQSIEEISSKQPATSTENRSANGYTILYIYICIYIYILVCIYIYILLCIYIIYIYAYIWYARLCSAHPLWPLLGSSPSDHRAW